MDIEGDRTDRAEKLENEKSIVSSFTILSTNRNSYKD